MDVTGLLRGYAKRPGCYPRPVFVLVGQVVVWVDGVALVSDADAEVQVDPSRVARGTDSTDHLASLDGVANCHLDAAMRQVPVDGVVAVVLDDDV